MSVKEQPPAPPPKLVTLNKAFKLAQQWVGQMTGDEEEEAGDMEVEGRPSRLGLGAKVPRKSEIRLSNDAVERRLQKKLGVGKRKSAEDDRPSPSTRNEASGGSDDEENLDSRTSAFAKKRTPPTAAAATKPSKKRK
uniref:Uncharacterized protein n=1 Tax=Opuntia streptacantha TaxID=393608 RepID=A0A7C8ZXL6_OPUST